MWISQRADRRRLFVAVGEIARDITIRFAGFILGKGG